MRSWALGCLLCAAVLPGCQRARTPEALCARLIQGVREGDAKEIFDSLLKSTQWSLYSVARSQRQMRDLIEDHYPKAERPAALLRLLHGEARDGRELFQALYRERYEDTFRRRLAAGPLQVQGAEGSFTCKAQGGAPFPLRKDAEGRLGMSELDREWELAKERAAHDLQTVRENARLYQGARSR